MLLLNEHMELNAAEVYSIHVQMICFHQFISFKTIEIAYIATSIEFWARVHKAFQNQDQDQAQVKNSFTMNFFKTYIYVTIDCWYLIEYVLQTRLLGILS